MMVIVDVDVDVEIKLKKIWLLEILSLSLELPRLLPKWHGKSPGIGGGGRMADGRVEP